MTNLFSAIKATGEGILSGKIDEWFKYTAKMGVLWLPTQLAIGPSEKDSMNFWHDFIEKVVGIVFQQKSSLGNNSGVVFFFIRRFCQSI